jgi:hypothetical protein
MKLSIKQTTFVLELEGDGHNAPALERLLDAMPLGHTELAARMREMLRPMVPQKFPLH